MKKSRVKVKEDHFCVKLLESFYWIVTFIWGFNSVNLKLKKKKNLNWVNYYLTK